MLNRTRIIEVTEEAFAERLHRLNLDLDRAGDDCAFYGDRESKRELARLEETERKVIRLESRFREALESVTMPRRDVDGLKHLLVFMAAYFENDAEGYDQEETDHRLNLARDLREAAKPVNLSQVTG